MGLPEEKASIMLSFPREKKWRLLVQDHIQTEKVKWSILFAFTRRFRKIHFMPNLAHFHELQFGKCGSTIFKIYF
jgi:hypothetical protein